MRSVRCLKHSFPAKLIQCFSTALVNYVIWYIFTFPSVMVNGFVVVDFNYILKSPNFEVALSSLQLEVFILVRECNHFLFLLIWSLNLKKGKSVLDGKQHEKEISCWIIKIRNIGIKKKFFFSKFNVVKIKNFNKLCNFVGSFCACCKDCFCACR